MASLHRRRVIHRSLKPSNVLLNWRDEPVLSDVFFNQALYPLPESEPLLLDGQRPNPIAASGLYWAPELITDRDFSEQTDVYAFGVLLYQLLSDRPLLGNLDMKRNIQPTSVGTWLGEIRGGRRFKYSPNISPFYWELIRACWASEPGARPTFRAIVEQMDEGKSLLKHGDQETVSTYRQRLQQDREA
jgi:serine/threonine protein kinase